MSPERNHERPDSEPSDSLQEFPENSSLDLFKQMFATATHKLADAGHKLADARHELADARHDYTNRLRHRNKEGDS